MRTRSRPLSAAMARSADSRVAGVGADAGGGAGGGDVGTGVRPSAQTTGSPSGALMAAWSSTALEGKRQTIASLRISDAAPRQRHRPGAYSSVTGARQVRGARGSGVCREAGTARGMLSSCLARRPAPEPPRRSASERQRTGAPPRRRLASAPDVGRHRVRRQSPPRRRASVVSPGRRVAVSPGRCVARSLRVLEGL